MLTDYPITNSPSRLLRLGLHSITKGGRYISNTERSKDKKYINKLNQRNKSFYYF
jgi:hypothetical protein